MQDKVATGISLPKKLKDKIDVDRGDISRSRYILRILKMYGSDESNKNNALNESRRKPQTHSADVNASQSSKSLGDSQIG